MKRGSSARARRCCPGCGQRRLDDSARGRSGDGLRGFVAHECLPARLARCPLPVRGLEPTGVPDPERRCRRRLCLGEPGLYAGPLPRRARREARLFATNSLVLAVPRSNPAKIRTVQDLAKRPKLKLVVAGAKVPIGLYTREVLKRLGLLRVLRKAVSQEPDVKGIVGKLAFGQADAGFVYATDVRAASSRLLAIPLPPRSQPTVRYEIAVVKGTENRAGALELVADLLGEDGRRELRRAGFGLP